MKRISLYASICTALLLVAASCGSRPTGSGRIEIATLRGPSSVAMARMMDSLSRCKNPDIAITVYDEPLHLRKAMLEGSADFAVLPTTMAALLYNRGIDYRVAAVPIWGSLYLCAEDSSIRGLKDLRGRKVYLMARGMTPDVMFRHLLSRSGLIPYQDVEIDYRFPSHIDLANAAMAGIADICILSEPYLSQALGKNRNLRIMADLGLEWEKAEHIRAAETAFLCSAALAESGSPIIKTMVDALKASTGWVLAHPDSAAAIAVRLGINPDSAAVVSSIPRSNFDVVGAADARDAIIAYLNVFLESSPEAIGNRIPDEKFFAK